MTAQARRSDNVWKWGLRLGSLALVALAWEFGARAIDSLLLPTFVEAMVALGELVLTPRLWQSVWVSNQAMLAGFLASLVLGVPLGLLMGRLRAVEAFGDVYLNLVLVTPMAPLIPVVILALGLKLEARALIVFLFAFVFVVINTRVGLRNVDRALIEMAHSFCATERQLWLKILLPGALPAIMTGVRIALGRAITGMVAVELLMVATGIGRLLIEYGDRFESGHVYAVVFVVLLEAVLLMELAKRVEKRLVPWESESAVA
jgi:NitT/TauT family transport system permease protein